MGMGYVDWCIPTLLKRPTAVDPVLVRIDKWMDNYGFVSDGYIHYTTDLPVPSEFHAVLWWTGIYNDDEHVHSGKAIDETLRC